MLLDRITKRIKITCNDFKHDLHFGCRLTFSRLLFNLTIRGKLLSGIHNWSKNQRDEAILSYLYKHNKDVFEKQLEYEKAVDSGEILKEKKYNIWVFWLQGEENAPPLVKKCIQSIRDNAPHANVVVLSDENIGEYVTLSDDIIKNRDNMLVAHFSDIVRVNLLREHGGLWLDATIFCTDEVDKSYFEYDLFSCKSEPKEPDYISKYRWTTFTIGGKKNSDLFYFLTNFFNSYWSKEKSAIDYLLFDYIIECAYRHFPRIKEQIDNIPYNNLKRDDYVACFNEPFDKEKYDEIMNSDTKIYKLSWREKFLEKTEDGKQTFFGHFLNGDNK